MRSRLQPEFAIRLSAWCARVCCALLALSFMSPLGQAQDKAAFSPYDVEAAYLYNFGKFVQWPSLPAANSQPFSICILGPDNVGKKLDDTIAGETIQGRKIVAMHVSSAEAADKCQIVFIGPSEDTRLAKDLEALQEKPVLTVSSNPEFLERGGDIQFLIQNNRVRFAVNLPAAKRSGLELSSELLKVAAYVKTDASKEARK
jgi:YfiR/HmsC-like